MSGVEPESLNTRFSVKLHLPNPYKENRRTIPTKERMVNYYRVLQSAVYSMNHCLRLIKTHLAESQTMILPTYRRQRKTLRVEPKT